MRYHLSWGVLPSPISPIESSVEHRWVYGALAMRTPSRPVAAARQRRSPPLAEGRSVKDRLRCISVADRASRRSMHQGGQQEGFSIPRRAHLRQSLLHWTLRHDAWTPSHTGPPNRGPLQWWACLPRLRIGRRADIPDDLKTSTRGVYRPGSVMAPDALPVSAAHRLSPVIFASLLTRRELPRLPTRSLPCQLIALWPHSTRPSIVPSSPQCPVQPDLLDLGQSLRGEFICAHTLQVRADWSQRAARSVGRCKP